VHWFDFQIGFENDVKVNIFFQIQVWATILNYFNNNNNNYILVLKK
jgi:hypothetical protein